MRRKSNKESVFNNPLYKYVHFIYIVLIQEK